MRMGLFDFFRKKRKIKAERKKRKRSSPSKRTPSFVKLKSGIENLQTQLSTVNIVLNKHNDQLSEHTRLINDNSKGLEKLERIVEAAKTQTPSTETTPITRLAATINPPMAAKPSAEEQGRKFDINRFSEQEKRILAVFFQNQGMALSYVDIARSLNKSPNTVKNQVNRIRLKADIFDKSVDNDSRNRFRLKNGLRIEKYLNVG